MRNNVHFILDGKGISTASCYGIFVFSCTTHCNVAYLEVRYLAGLMAIIEMKSKLTYSLPIVVSSCQASMSSCHEIVLTGYTIAWL